MDFFIKLPLNHVNVREAVQKKTKNKMKKELKEGGCLTWNTILNNYSVFNKEGVKSCVLLDHEKCGCKGWIYA